MFFLIFNFVLSIFTIHAQSNQLSHNNETLENVSEFSGLKLIELYFSEADVPKDLNHRFSDYTLVIIEDKPSVAVTAEVRNAMDLLLRSAETVYLDVHRDGGRLLGAESMLDSVSKGPDRFLDGRSSYALIVNASAHEIVRQTKFLGYFPSELVMASLRVSTVSKNNPLLPFAMNLEGNPKSLVVPKTSSELSYGSFPRYGWEFRSAFPFTEAKSFITQEEITVNRGGVGFGNEVKAFMVKKVQDKQIDWMPFLVQALEHYNLVARTGLYTDPKSKKVFFENEGTSKNLLEVMPAYHYAEVITPTSEFEDYLKDGKPRGLIKMYMQLGFEIELDSVKKLSAFPKLMVIPLKINRDTWVQSVIGTEKRPGMRWIFKSYSYAKSYRKRADAMETRYRPLPPEPVQGKGSLRCIQLFSQ